MNDEAAATRSVTEIFVAHGRAMLSRARRILRSDYDADDAVQEIMLGLISAPNSLGVVERIRGWLLGLVHRRCVDLIRSSRRRETKESSGALGGVFNESDPEKIAEREELCKVVAEAVDALPGDLRWAFVKNALEDMKFREMSEVSGIPMGTLMARKAKAVEIVREKLRRQGYTD